MAELVVAGLGKSYGGRKVLDDVSLDVRSGALVAILGASGSGKTTLLRVICGFERADTGSIVIDGLTMSGPGVHVPPDRRKIGYVAQDGALFPHLTVADNILFGLPRSERKPRTRLAELLDMVGLPIGFAERSPQQLSGGEQQRVALARALAPKPRLVLLDEPFSALDAALRADTRQVVAAALSAAGATALLVTHDQPEALSMGDPVAVLRHGHLVQVANPRALYHVPNDADLAGFVGEAVIMRGIAREGRVVCALGNLPLGPNMPVGEVDVLIRPEQIRLVPFRYGAGVWAKVEDVKFFGPDAAVRLTALQEGATLSFTARVVGHRAPQPQDEVSAVVEGDVVTFPTRG
jgi:iron(III) transport system ATP-binding protein